MDELIENPAIYGGILFGKEFVVFIARLDPPFKGRDCGEHSVQPTMLSEAPSGKSEKAVAIPVGTGGRLWGCHNHLCCSSSIVSSIALMVCICSVSYCANVVYPGSSAYWLSLQSYQSCLCRPIIKMHL